MDCDSGGNRILELSGLVSALNSGVCCKSCLSGPIEYKESRQNHGLCTNPYLYCASCFESTPIPFATIPSSKVKVINRKAVLATKFLRRKDLRRLKLSVYKLSDSAKKLRKRRKRIRKGLEDQHAAREGVVYAAGAFDAGDDPGPSSPR